MGRRGVAGAAWSAALAAAVAMAGQQAPALSRGIELYWNGQYEQALQVLSDEAIGALGADEQPEALTYRAFSQVALARNEEARASFSRLLELDPGHRLDPSVVSPKIAAQFGAARAALATAQFETARGRYESEDYDAALIGFEAVLALDPAHALAGEYRQLARAHLDLAEEEAAAATPTPPPVEPGRIYNVTGAIEAPVIEERVEPEYPRLDAMQGNRGTVVLLVVVDERGGVRDTRVLRSVNARLDAAALRAVKRWRYRPAQLAGVAVPVYRVVTLQFVP